MGWYGSRTKILRFRLTSDFFVTIDDRLAEVRQQLRCTIFARCELEKIGGFVKEPRRCAPRLEQRVIYDVLEKRNIRDDTANADPAALLEAAERIRDSWERVRAAMASPDAEAL